MKLFEKTKTKDRLKDYNNEENYLHIMKEKYEKKLKK